MTARVGYVLSALVLGLGALVGVQYSSATFTDDSTTPTQVTSARDWTAPTVSVDDPRLVISGVVSITATAVDEDTSVATVEIQYRQAGQDWTSICVDSESPWACTWDTDSVVDGNLELRAIATDVDGNVRTSATVVTDVRNSRGVVLEPVPSPVRGTVTLTAFMVNSGKGTPKMTFQRSTTGGGWVDLPGCVDVSGESTTCLFNTAALADGSYDLRVVAIQGRRTYTDVQTGVVIDNTAPSVTINQAATQADPSGSPPVEFTVVFSEPVTGFDDSDVTVEGTVAGARAVTVTGSGTTYAVTISGFTGSGTVTASIGSGRASDAAGNSNLASTSTDNEVTVDATLPTVTVEQAVGQADPTNVGTINFTVLFSKNVTGFNNAGVVLSGTAGDAMSAAVTGSGKTYNVAVTGMSHSGTVVASVPAGRAVDAVGNVNVDSTSVDDSVLYDITAPTVTIDQAATQKDPTNGSTINFTAVFNEPVTGFTGADITIGGTATGTKTATVTGSGTTYNVAVTGMTGTNVTVIASVAGGKAFDLAGNGNTASTSVDNVVTRDTVAPTATLVRGPDQITPTTTSPISFVVTFSEEVTGFDANDLTVTGTSGGTKVVTVTGSGTTYNVDITGMTSDGTVIVSQVPASAATDLAGNANTASAATSTVRTITWNDGVAPSVTINQAQGQADPTATSPITFTVVFSEPVTGFTNADITLGGTALGAKIIVVSGTGPTYTVTVSGMTTGTVIASIGAAKATDLGGRTNTASTSTDNSVSYDACVDGSSTLTATADAWTDQSLPAQNNGSDTSLVIGSQANANKRVLVKFTLPFSSACAVSVATLRVYNATPTSGRTIDVFRAATDWAEETVTWGAQPATAGTAVGVATVAAAGYQQWNVLTHVRTLSTGSNFGFVLRDRTESAATAVSQRYQSRQSGANLPQLVVTWN